MTNTATKNILQALELGPSPSGASTGKWLETTGDVIESMNPANETVIGTVRGCHETDYQRVMDSATTRFSSWRTRPAPIRGQLVARLGELLRQYKEPLGELISLEMGKIRSEGLGEVQEMIDICDFAVGLSRQLHGLTIASERPHHRMMEQWHPMGPVAIITAFNFPMAVWAWNAALAAVCGDVSIWKPSPTTPLCGVAVQNLCNRAMKEHDAAGVWNLLVGGNDAGEWLTRDPRIPIVSFTGSIAVGRTVAAQVASRLARSILELGGNNAVTVLEDANMDLVVRGVTFGAVGTAGQRCTTTRRVFAQESIIEDLSAGLVNAYSSVAIGDPLDPKTLMGPLVSKQSVQRYESAIETAVAQGGEVLVGGKAMDGPGHFVAPTLIRAPDHAKFPIAWEETFAPILYLFSVADLEQAIESNNAVTQGLSSAIFTNGLMAAERFLSASGSDCGIANVNLGTSGAEIGGAFGGEKDTGGGRESGSDAWKGYMRRQTCTINWGSELPLAQGVDFTALS